MPTLEDTLRKEEDLFSPDRQTEEASSPAVAPPTLSEEEKRGVAEPTQKEAMAPHLLAELPQQTEASPEDLARLFKHYSEKAEDGDTDNEEHEVVSPGEQKQGLRDPLPHQLGLDDLVQDGMDADFVQDSAIVAADLDTHPTPDVDGWEKRRRAAQAAKAAAVDTPAETEPAAAPQETATAKEEI